MTGKYSPHIYRLRDYLKALGCEVKFHQKLRKKDGLHCVGNCDYKKKLIRIGDIPNAKYALMTLLHECGHWISYLEIGQDKDFLKRKQDDLRERFAKHHALETIHRMKIPITVLEYLKFESEP